MPANDPLGITLQGPASFDVARSMRLVLLACLPGALALLWFNGWGVLLQLSIAAASALACEALVRRLREQPSPRAEEALFGIAPLAEGGALVSAVLLGLALPASTPWWLTASASAFAILFGKSLWGGFGHNPLNPAMLGYAFALIAFPAPMSQWPQPGEWNGLSLLQIVGATPADGWSGATLLDVLKHNDRLTQAELFATHPAFGHVGGRGGEGVNLAFLLGGLLLLQRRVIAWRVPAGMLGALFVIALLCWNGSGSDSNGSPLLHLFSGASMLGAFFIATEPVSGARSPRGQWAFGIGVGLLTYAIRTWGNSPDGLAFAVLAMNLAVPALERIVNRSAAR